MYSIFKYAVQVHYCIHYILTTTVTSVCIMRRFEIAKECFFFVSCAVKPIILPYCSVGDTHEGFRQPRRD